MKSVWDIEISFLFLLSFGCHYWRSALPVFEIYFLESKFLTQSSYGLLLSLESTPALLATFLIGYLYDNLNHKYVVLSLSTVALAGQFLFAVAAYQNSLALAACGQLLFGVGAYGVVTAQRALIAQIFMVVSLVMCCE